MSKWDVVWDIESNNLLNNSSIDYTSTPYKLKDSFVIHCIVVSVLLEGKEFLYGFHEGEPFIFDGRKHEVIVEGNTYTLEEGYEPVEYIYKPLKDFPKFVKKLPEGSTVRGHNIVNFDLLVTKLYWGIPYEVEKDMDMDSPLGDDYWGGKKVIFDDTLIRSKTLNPDRFGGHSLEALAKEGDTQKFEFRKHLPQDQRFQHFGPDMLYYNIFDVKSNRSVAKMLDEEMKEFDWGDKWNKAIKLEKAVAELITRQEHRGFKFDVALAEANIAELDKLMEERKSLIEPILPPRKATKKVMNDFTPPKIQFKKDGSHSANLIKFAEKIGATIKDNVFLFGGKEYPLPLPREPLVTTMEATINDTTHIKEWLVGEGWLPLEYKEKDLTVDSKKFKLKGERLQAAIDRYLDQTLESNFWKDRAEQFNISAKTPKEAVNKLRREFERRLERGRGGIRVLTNPSFTVGVEKEICPNLLKLAEERKDLEVLLQITEYLTYRHRRNSILGGGVEWDEDEEPEKGFVSHVRDDGRVPTPADTCGAGTSRFKHRVVVNIPRATSLYGDKMRAMFTADSEVAYQLGYDFSSLEARIEGHHCWEHDGEDKEYCNSLTLEKPNDVHSRTARQVAELLKMDFGRTPAKSVKYCLTYGGGPPKVAKIIGNTLAVGNSVSEAFWIAAKPLASFKESMSSIWKQFDRKRIIGLDGRLVPTRSEHALVNSAFQSGGVICAKRTMVLHDRELQKEGLLVDFFTESLKNRKRWAQQLIAMHDEAQMEVSRESVTFKRFKTEEEAVSFKREQESCGKVWSDVQESPKGGYFVAYCREGHIISEVVDRVTKDYNLNVPLEAGYVIGRSWKECH